MNKTDIKWAAFHLLMLCTTGGLGLLFSGWMHYNHEQEQQDAAIKRATR